jgi:hypothetical protein
VYLKDIPMAKKRKENIRKKKSRRIFTSRFGLPGFFG